MLILSSLMNVTFNVEVDSGSSVTSVPTSVLFKNFNLGKLKPLKGKSIDNSNLVGGFNGLITFAGNVFLYQPLIITVNWQIKPLMGHNRLDFSLLDWLSVFSRGSIKLVIQIN